MRSVPFFLSLSLSLFLKMLYNTKKKYLVCLELCLTDYHIWSFLDQISVSLSLCPFYSLSLSLFLYNTKVNLVCPCSCWRRADFFRSRVFSVISLTLSLFLFFSLSMKCFFATQKKIFVCGTVGVLYKSRQYRFFFFNLLSAPPCPFTLKSLLSLSLSMALSKYRAAAPEKDFSVWEYHLYTITTTPQFLNFALLLLLSSSHLPVVSSKFPPLPTSSSLTPSPISILNKRYFMFFT